MVAPLSYLDSPHQAEPTLASLVDAAAADAKVTQAVAQRKGISLGKAVSELARSGFECAPITVPGGDSTVFAIPADAKPITNEDVARSLNDWPEGG